MPPMGTLNLHGSLLPQYRGAAPINWAIINGETLTGATTFKLKHEIDTGDILCAGEIEIDDNMTAGELHDSMKEAGASLLVSTLKGLADGTLKEVPQVQLSGNVVLKHAPKIFTDTCRIDWTKSTSEIHNLIRGLSPFPAAFTQLDGKTLKIYKSSKEQATTCIAVGQHTTDGKTYLKFACADGFILIHELQLEGKKRMFVADFLRGYRFGG
jgi:methionyl-tRNA formyltransferase